MRLTLELDTRPVSAAFDALPELLRLRTLEACRQTAEAIVQEAQSRLTRQLSPRATGKTVAGIHAVRAFDGQGYVVLSDRDPMPNVPLWLEKGTNPGKRHNFARTAPRPYFYSSIELELGSHERRLLAAMDDAAEAVGLGDAA